MRVSLFWMGELSTERPGLCVPPCLGMLFMKHWETLDSTERDGKVPMLRLGTLYFI